MKVVFEQHGATLVSSEHKDKVAGQYSTKAGSGRYIETKKDDLVSFTTPAWVRMTALTAR
jgi:hypothetical protein